MKRKRIFIGMVEIAGYYGNLAFALKKKGYQVTIAGSSSHIYQYDSDVSDSPLLVRIYDQLIKSLSVKRTEEKSKLTYLLKRKMTALLAIFMKIALFFWSIPIHDVYIFGFGISFFPENLDLLFLKLFKKRIICNLAHGSDARPPYIDGSRFSDLNHLGQESESLINLSKTIKNTCLQIEKYADIVIGSPLSCHFLEQPFVSTFYLGVPFKGLPEDVLLDETKPDLKAHTIRILHCPSNPLVKGTPLIREAIRSLKAKGYSIEFIELIGQPNSVVLQELNACDFVVDQVYSDFPMAGFATEAAWFKKPAIVGGYGWSRLDGLIPNDVLPSTHLCHPADIESAIEKLIVDSQYRCALGQRAYDFVTSNWHVDAFADRYLKLVNGAVPEKWWATPGQIPYIQGCGLSEDSLLEILKPLLKHSKDVLQLGDKPLLEKAFLDFLNSEVVPK
ncbi:MAG: glycosyltransferase [Leptolyngbyaceae cyanobacterium]